MKRSTVVVFGVLALVILVKAAFPSQSKQLQNAVEEGKLLLKIVRDNDILPTYVDLSSFRKGARYVRVMEDENTFYIAIPVKHSRDCVIYYEGPLYPKNGWYFHNQKISE
jgi:hypothetical protein